MNTLQLQCFLEVADQRSYAAAAKILHLSQPAVTKKIQSLEAELQVKLFDRDTRHVRLTEEGRVFYPNARSICAQEQNIRTTLLHFRQKKQYHLFIGTFGQEVHLFLDKVLPKVHAALPNLRTDIISAGYNPLEKGLESRSLDLVVGEAELFNSRQAAEAAYEKLADMQFYLVLPAFLEKNSVPDSLDLTEVKPETLDRIFPGSDRLTCADLDRILRTRPELEPCLSLFYSRTLSCDNMEAALTLVRAGFGCLFMPESPLLFRPGLRYVPIKNGPVFQYGLFYEKNNPNPALKKIREVLRTWFSPS